MDIILNIKNPVHILIRKLNKRYLINNPNNNNENIQLFKKCLN